MATTTTQNPSLRRQQLIRIEQELNDLRIAFNAENHPKRVALARDLNKARGLVITVRQIAEEAQ